MIPNKYKDLTLTQVEVLVDKGLRHISGVTPDEYKEHFLNIARDFAYATKDGSWGEFEKLFTIMVKRLIQLERVTEQNLFNALTELQDSDTGTRVCRLCGKINTHRLDSKCEGDWVDYH